MSTIPKREILSAKAKALEINLNPLIYGTLAEIGAGQEVARQFFTAGGASGTIAKTMSAYDMVFSDAIYGKEPSGRYVCESRLHKMLDREFELLIERLSEKRNPDTTYFVFADTVATKKYGDDRPGHGWLGVTFQLHPKGPANKLIIHVNLLDKDSIEEQDALGNIGVNLIYSCFYFNRDPYSLVSSLMDNLNSQRIEVDMISLTGPDFQHIDNRILSLFLVKTGMTNAVMFDGKGKVIQPSEVLYKKNILALRGSFRPPTLVNMDMIEAALKQFQEESSVEADSIVTLCELTLDKLMGQADIDEADFLARVDLLGALGQNVLVSNYRDYYRLSSYFARYTKNAIVIALGVDTLMDLFKEDQYKNLWGGILEAMGRLFSLNVQIYLYPKKNVDEDGFISSTNVKIPKKLKHLYEYLKDNGYIKDIKYSHKELTKIFSREVLRMVQSGTPGWEEMVPESVAKAIKNKCLFGYPCKFEP